MANHNCGPQMRAWYSVPENKERHKMACREWKRPSTEARDAAFERLYREGRTLREIAAEFDGVTFQRVHQVLKARGVKFRAKHNGAEVA